MKKFGLFLLLFLLACAFSACKGDDTTDVKLEIEDIVLTKGEETEIDYRITPEGTFGVVSFEIISGSEFIAITGTTLRALEVGTAQVKATAVNMKGAKKTFSTGTTFTVTVEPITSAEGEFILNGGFEFGLLEWSIVSNPANYSYGTTVVDNTPHSGEAALNLWFDADGDEKGEALDLTLSQTLSGLENKTYLFSLWFKGAITSVTMKVKAGEEVLSSGEFSGYDYKPVADHSGYVHYGIEVTLSGRTSVTVEIKLTGDPECWGYVDDVSFKEGSLDDLEKAPETPEAGHLNFIKGGGFADLSKWTVEITGQAANKEANPRNGQLSIWANGAATYRISQKLWLPEASYNLVIYFNGGELGTEFNVDEGYAYVKQGDVIHKLDFEPTGYGDGSLTRIELEGIELEGEVEVGLYFNFTSGSNNWINLDDFTLYAPDLEIKADDLEAAEAVVELIEALDVENLTLADEEDVKAARAAFDALTPLQKLLVSNEEKLLQAEAKIDELKKPDPVGYINFVKDGDFKSGNDFETSITGDASDKGILFADNTLKIWAKGAAEVLVKQVITGLEADTYQLVIELNGGWPGSEFDVSEAYVYVKQGEAIRKENLVPEGWNEGVYKKLYILNIAIVENVDVEVGIKIIFTGGSNNWINFKNLHFWSMNIPEPEPTDEDLQAAAAVDALIEAFDLETLTLEDEEDVAACRAAFEALTDLQKTLVTKLDDLLALEAKIQELKGVVDYPLVTLEEFNEQGGFESDDWSLATLKWKFEGGHGWTEGSSPFEGSKRYDVFKEQTSTTARIYKGVKDAAAGTYQLSLYLAGGSLTGVKVILGSEEYTITEYTGDYQKFTFFHEHDGEGHLYVEISITRETGGWASLDAISLTFYDYPIVSLEEFNLQGGFEPVDGDWSLAGLCWKVEGGNAWTWGDWPHEGIAKYDVFFQMDSSMAATLSKAVLLEPGSYTLTIHAAGGNLTKFSVEIGGETNDVTVGGSYKSQTFNFEVAAYGPVLIKVTAERSSSAGWLNLDTFSISVDEE
mgnify:FL=1